MQICRSIIFGICEIEIVFNSLHFICIAQMSKKVEIYIKEVIWVEICIIHHNSLHYTKKKEKFECENGYLTDFSQNFFKVVVINVVLLS